MRLRGCGEKEEHKHLVWELGVRREGDLEAHDLARRRSSTHGNEKANNTAEKDERKKKEEVSQTTFADADADVEVGGAEEEERGDLKA